MAKILNIAKCSFCRSRDFIVAIKGPAEFGDKVICDKCILKFKNEVDGLEEEVDRE